MSYEFRKDKILNRGRTIANIRDGKLREGNGSRTICNIKDDKVRDGNGSSTVLNVKNGDIREKSGSRRLARVRDVRKEIKNGDTFSDVYIAAVWHYIIN